MSRVIVAKTIVPLFFLLLTHSLAQTGAEELIAQRLQGARVNRLEESGFGEVTRSPTGTRVFNSASKTVVLVMTEKSQGSGVILLQSGHVLTNWHVIEDPGNYIGVVTFPTSGEFTDKDVHMVEFVRGAQNKDLAILRMIDPPAGLTIAEVAPFSVVQVGQDVHAIGHPQSPLWTYTPGVVSQIRPNFPLGEFLGTVIQTQAVISFGSSGGALFNDAGQLIGITTFRLEQGLNFAVAANEIISFWNQ